MNSEQILTQKDGNLLEGKSIAKQSQHQQFESFFAFLDRDARNKKTGERTAETFSPVFFVPISFLFFGFVPEEKGKTFVGRWIMLEEKKAVLLPFRGKTLMIIRSSFPQEKNLCGK